MNTEPRILPAWSLQTGLPWQEYHPSPLQSNKVVDPWDRQWNHSNKDTYPWAPKMRPDWGGILINNTLHEG